MHVYLLIKVWDQMRSGWDMHTGVNMFLHTYVKGQGRLWEGEIDMNTWTDACTPPDQGVGQDEGWLEHAYMTHTGVHIFL